MHLSTKDVANLHSYWHNSYSLQAEREGPLYRLCVGFQGARNWKDIARIKEGSQCSTKEHTDKAKLAQPRQVLQKGSAKMQTGLASALGQDVFHLSSLKLVRVVCVCVWGGESSSAYWWDLNFTVWWDWMEGGFGKHESLSGYLW